MSRRTATTAATSAVLAALALTGCGSGRDAQTYQQRTTADSTNAVVGEIAIRNLAVAAPSSGNVIKVGDSAQVLGSFVNQGGAADRIVSASSSAASSTALLLGPKGQTALEVPPNGISDAAASIVLHGLNRDLVTGSYVDLTLVFERNGRTTVRVPVRAGVAVRPEASTDPFQPATTG